MTSINVCIIEDGPETLETLKAFFELRGHKVLDFNSAEAFEKAGVNNFRGLYLVDWRLPGVSGIDLIRSIRMRDQASPIFIISALDQKTEIVEGLQAGADDYITKPFNYEELHARATNALKKYNMYNANEELGINLLPQFCSFTVGEKMIKLTQSEYKIFSGLYEHINFPVTRETLMEKFSDEEGMNIRNIDVHVFSMRKKICEVGLTIEAVHRVGYRLLVTQNL